MDIAFKAQLESLLIQVASEISDADRQEGMHYMAGKNKVSAVKAYADKIAGLLDSATGDDLSGDDD